MSNDIYPTIKGLTWTVTKTPKFGTIVQQAANMAEVRIEQSQNPIWTWQLIYEYIYDNFYSAANSMPYTPATDLRELMGFFLARQGMYDDFLFDDPSDDWVGPMTWKPRYDFNPGQAIIDPSGREQTWSGGQTGATAPAFNTSTVADGSGVWTYVSAFPGVSGQTLGLINDGMPTPTYYTPLQRNMGGLFLEDVTDVNVSVNPVRIWANGVLKTLSSDYTINGPGLVLPGYSYSGKYLTWLTTPTAPITAAFNFYFRVRFLSDDLDFEQFMQQLWTIGGSGGKNGRGALELVTARPATA